MQPSGKQWVSQFPTSRSIEDLTDPFRTNVRRFLAALQQAKATVTIADTLRRPERAYLMFFSFVIARNHMEPDKVPPMPGVGIEWVHKNAQGQPDPVASKTAAEQMVQAYGIVFQPSLFTRHTEGKAIDMNITWQNDLVVVDGHGAPVTIASSPRHGGGNADLNRVASSYGVMKLLSDPPHWSLDGH